MDTLAKLNDIIDCGLYTKVEIAYILIIDVSTLRRWLSGAAIDDLHTLKINELWRIKNVRLQELDQ